MKYLYFIFLLVCYLDSRAQSGLDPTFGNNGMVIVPNTPNNAGLFSAIAIQSDLKILVGGGERDILAMRYNADGTVDHSFANNGKFSNPLLSLDGATTCGIQQLADGKIVLAGSANGSANFYVARLKEDGTLDSTFGTNGITRTGFNTQYTNVYTMAIQPDGKIVLAGEAHDDIALARYKPNGIIDSTFGTNGKTRIINGLFSGTVEGVGIMSDGRIMIGGLGYAPSQSRRAFMSIRFLPDGSFDTSYNHTGTVYTYIPGGLTTYVNCAALQPDGKMILGGSAADGVVLRYDTTGSLDTTFNHNGIYHHPAGVSIALLVQPDGKILAGGENEDLYLFRINANGTTDSSFGRQGSILTDVHGNTDFIRALAMQPDGKILAAGEARNTPSAGSGYADPVIVRYKKDAATAIGKVVGLIQGLAIFPNPAHQNFTVSNKTGQLITQVTLIDASGKQLFTITGTKDTEVISTARLASGRYYIRCTLKDGRTATSPLLIQH